MYARRMTAALVAVALTMALTVAVMVAAGPALAGDDSFELTIREHRFEPDVLEIPAGKRVKLLIHNKDATPEEFESHDLNREKVIPGGATGIVYVGPLSPGTYKFFGEFHEATAQGRIIVK